MGVASAECEFRGHIDADRLHARSRQEGGDTPWAAAQITNRAAPTERGCELDEGAEDGAIDGILGPVTHFRSDEAHVGICGRVVDQSGSRCVLLIDHGATLRLVGQPDRRRYGTIEWERSVATIWDTSSPSHGAALPGARPTPI